ncbi:Membrane protein involved in the export of O-antigen and teichoic acid [Flexibacter flexilis DSM 6793]|uniref:Membrane protein involved in the export of O-antigen and teichoic acid n=2 Tax=Flexibacter flexilis TaxID=998 RepID=A0A1I1DFE8_9BACT|nr:Membrane protein involved in the export of O-antigen and teichoic acid [Flexibacter flexilis DSM 6793]
MLSVVARALAALSINKLFALYFGATGVALLSHFQNLTGILIALPNDGINRGMIKYASSPKASVRRRAWLAGLGWQALVMIVITLLLWFFGDYFLAEFEYSNTSAWLIVFFGGLWLYALHFFFLGVLLSEQKLLPYTFINIGGSVAVVLICGVLVWQWHTSLGWALIYFWIGTTLVGLFSWVYVWRTVRFSLPIRWLFSTKFYQFFWRNSPFRAIGGYVLTALAVVTFGRMVDFHVREYVIHRFGMEQTGWWQAVVRLGDLYILPTTAIINSIFYPKITNSLPDKALVRSYVREVMRWVVPAAALGFGAMFLVKEYALVWVNAAGFEQAAFLMKYQMAGDFMKVISYFFASIVVAQARVRLMLVMELLSVSVYLSCIFTLAPSWGIEGIALSHLIRYCFYTSTLYALYRYHFRNNGELM